MRKLITAIFILILLVTAALPALAAADEEYAAAQRLYELGLFKGRGTDAQGEPDFDLDSPATRGEAVVMLLRLEGRRHAEQVSGEDCPFTDVSGWARGYLYYASAAGLVQGRSDTFFDAQSSVTAAEYLTMVLRALWYHTEAAGTYEKDFDWDMSWVKADEIGLTNGEYNENTESFTRGDMARISARALGCSMNGYNFTMLERVDSEGGLRDAQNIAPITAGSYFDGETARTGPILRLVSEEFAGERQTYAHMDDLPLLLAAAAGTLEISDDGSVSAQYTQSGTDDRFVRDFGAFSVEQDISGVGMAIYAREQTISLPASASDGELEENVEARTLTVREHPRPEWLWRLHFNSGVRYFYADTETAPSTGYGFTQYVNADDLLACFGFDCTLELSEGTDGELVWSLEWKGASEPEP